jgi:hypothetical protein
LKNEFIKENAVDEKFKIFKINDEDKLCFNTIDEIVEGLVKEFRDFSKDYIIQSLYANSFNLYNTYKFLLNPLGGQSKLNFKLNKK